MAFLYRALLIAGSLSALACSDVTNDRLPVGVSDPASLATPDGARQMYQSAVNAFVYTGITSSTASPGAFLTAVVAGGLLTDELQVSGLGGPPLEYEQSSTGSVDGTQNSGPPPGDYALDARQLPELLVDPSGVRQSATPIAAYAQLQAVRSRTSQAIGALAEYAPGDSALRGHMYALSGYAELLLADLFCSGVPLSTVDYKGDYTLHAGSTTAAVYQHAITQFDRAIALSADSARFLNLARIGKGRAWLALGRYDSAATAVQDVPEDFTYDILVDWSGGFPGASSLLTAVRLGTGTGSDFSFNVSVADSDGVTGQPFRSSQDPRTAAMQLVLDASGSTPVLETNRFGTPIYYPAKFGVPVQTGPITVANGIEARLILAEASLHGASVGGDWLTILKTLRAEHAPAPSADSLVDPGNEADRISLLFSERAAWLFLTGHRQGDLRRLVRPIVAGGYGLLQSQVYPSGPYPVLFGQHGFDVTLPIPSQERINPNFTGCLSRGA